MSGQGLLSQGLSLPPVTRASVFSSSGVSTRCADLLVTLSRSFYGHSRSSADFWFRFRRELVSRSGHFGLRGSVGGLNCSLGSPRSVSKYAGTRKHRARSRMTKMDVSPVEFHSYSDNDQLTYVEGPSCIFVGPLEKAEKARLEALYQQARDSYYSGRPLIVDDMFDRVETKLRWHGSKVVLKYPRCSLKRYSAYSDAEIDSSQMWALGSVWGILLAFGVVAAAAPPACAINAACQKSVRLRFESHGVTAASEAVMYLNGLLAIGMGLIVGVPIALAAGSVAGDLVAMKGCCPGCGEEVYAFVRADQSGQTQQKSECHVCEHTLMFRANVERSSSLPGHIWAYGRVYLSTQSKDLEPRRKD